MHKKRFKLKGDSAICQSGLLASISILKYILPRTSENNVLSCNLNSTLMKFFEGRQPIDNIDEVAIEEAFAAIVESFLFPWLTYIKGSNPLQLLWSRKDALATRELFFFGYHLQKLAVIDSKWVKEQVKLIKGNDYNSRLGAFFEINALGFFTAGAQNVKPARSNNPGTDGTIYLTANKSIRLSLKNYGNSWHYQNFLNECKKLEAFVNDLFQARGIVTIQLFIDAFEKFPEKSNWQSIKDGLPTILDSYDPSVPQNYVIDNFWLITIFGIRDGEQKFHPNHNSYTILATSVYHQNEKVNLLSKLGDACANLVKHHMHESDDVINFAMIHLPELASIIQCRKWVFEYFDQNPTKPISGIILYQPTIANDVQAGTKNIHNCLQIITRPEKAEVLDPIIRSMTIKMPVGTLDENSAETHLTFIKDGVETIKSFQEFYWFQSGNHYLQQLEMGDGTLQGQVTNPAPGIQVHSIMQPFPGNAAIQISGHFSPDDKLSII